MSIYSKLEGIRQLSNSSLTSIVDVTNLNFKSLSEANLTFLEKINYSEFDNSFKLDKGTFKKVDITDVFSLTLDGIPTFTINSRGKAEGQELLVIVSESQRHRFTDFNDWPDVGVPGEVIYTGVQNQRPEFGEDFIGYLDGRGWVSLTNLTAPVDGLYLLPEAGSPLVIPTVPANQGLIWIGPPGSQTTYEPVNTTVYFTDDDGNTFDIMTDFAWEIIGDDAKFKPPGKAIIGDVLNPGKFQFVDNNQSAGYILHADGNGNAYWGPNLGSGAPLAPNYSYWEINDYLEDVAITIDHNLNTDNVVVDLIDVTTNERVEGHIDNYTINSLDVTLVEDRSNVKVVIMGSGAIGTNTQANIRVSALGDATYIGTADAPGITSYENDVIYLVEFQLNNVGPSTLEVDGLATYPIEKSTISGFVDLDPNDILSGVIYYLVWDGSRFQFFTTDPGSSFGNYTNLNTVPSTIGGIAAGSTFSNQTMQQMWDALLYPFQVPQFTSFNISGQSTTLEVGETVNNISRTFNWSTSNSGNITPNTVSISNITGGTVVLASGLVNDGNETITLPSPITYTAQASHVWQITATRTNASTMSDNYQINWRWRRFWGTSNNTILTESQIESLAGNSLSTSMNGTFSMAAGGYKYFAVPTTFAEPTFIKDNSTGLGVAMADIPEGYTDVGSGIYKFRIVPITNIHGVTQDYRVYRSKNMLGGSIVISVT
jgi:hypothetical protein